MRRFGVILLFVFVSLATMGYYQQETGGEDQFLRLHIVANSDNDNDQELKLQVRDKVLQIMNTRFNGVSSASEAQRIARAEIDLIRQSAQEEIHYRGYDYPVQVYVGEYEFPTKAYGDLVLPQGKYDALKVVIGEGDGKNWWCVLFPPLCLVAENDKGISLSAPQDAKVTLKCLKILPESVQEKIKSHL